MLVAILTNFDTGDIQTFGAIGATQDDLDSAIEAAIRAHSEQQYIDGCDSVYDASQGTWWSVFMSLHSEIQIHTAEIG